MMAPRIVARTGQGLALILAVGCSKPAAWQHDAGPPFDAAGREAITFPAALPDAQRADAGRADRPAPRPLPIRWRRRLAFPDLVGFRGSRRRAAAAGWAGSRAAPARS